MAEIVEVDHGAVCLEVKGCSFGSTSAVIVSAVVDLVIGSMGLLVADGFIERLELQWNELRRTCFHALSPLSLVFISTYR